MIRPRMARDANEIFRAQVGYGELERLSALETLKGLRHPEAVTLGDLVHFLDARGLWPQFAKITLGDLRDSFAVSAQNSHGTLVLGIKIIDRVSGKVLYQDQAGKFGVLRVSN